MVFRRGEAPVEEIPGLDPANQSLAEALRVAFRVLQLAVIALVVVFLASGFQTVKEGERGIRLLFGKPYGQDLEPGPHWAAPFPIGELRTVSTGNQTVSIEEDFWPMLAEDDKMKKVEQLVGTHQLNPANDGSLITGDGALIHAKLQITYRRSDATRSEMALHPDHVERIVRSAVKTAMIEVSAQTPIELLLTQTSGELGSLGVAVRGAAQRILDHVTPLGEDASTGTGCGIVVDSVAIVSPIPPLFVRDDFSEVQSAESTRSTTVLQAQTFREDVLGKVAGAAAKPLLAMIEQYEDAIREHGLESAEAEAALSDIFSVMEGNLPRNIETVVPATGEVASILESARQYRSSISSLRRAQYERFRGVAEQYKKNPSVALTQAWTQAIAAFMDHDYLDTLFFPASMSSLDITVAMDADIAELAEQIRLIEKGQKAREERLRMTKESAGRVDTSRTIQDAN